MPIIGIVWVVTLSIPFMLLQVVAWFLVHCPRQTIGIVYVP